MKKLALITLLLTLTVFLSACSISFRRSGDLSTASGVFASNNRGDTWRNVSFMPSASGEPVSLAHLDILDIVIDPSDSQALYMTTYGRGLFFTYNLANGWQRIDNLPSTTIRSIAINPKNKCQLFATVDNRLYGSNDCGRSWNQLYFDNNPDVAVTAVVVDHYNPHNLYIATSRGEIVKSIDQGVSWRTIHRFNENIVNFKMSPQDSRLFFVTTSNNKFYRFNSLSLTSPSNRQEENFSISNLQDLSKVISDFRAGNIQEINICSQEGIIILATNQKILRSPDSGVTWENIELIPDQKDAEIRAVAVNPRNFKEIYYVTHTSFYRSFDGGITWNTRRLPTSRVGSVLLVNPDNPQMLYLGVRRDDK